MVYWLNICIVALALLVGGATMAFIYLVVPLFFAFGVAFYLCKLVFEIWIWRRIPPDERHNHHRLGHLMNYNYVMSVKMEWLFFWAGFFGLVLWINYARSVYG